MTDVFYCAGGGMMAMMPATGGQLPRRKGNWVVIDGGSARKSHTLFANCARLLSLRTWG